MSKIYKLGVIGDPIDHSLSPFIHSRFGRQENISLDYRAYKVSNIDLNSFIDEFFSSKSAKGLNITLPHKKNAVAAVDKLSEEASFLEAINTINQKSTMLYGHTTDGDGLIKDLNEKNINIKDKRILIIGAGAAIESVLYKIINAKPATLTILNRTIERAEILQVKYRSMINISIRAESSLYDLVINGSSAGLTGEFSPPDESLFNKDTIFYDLNYSLNGTSFCNWAENISENSYDGTGMLIAQAALSFYEWFGVMPDTKKIANEISDL